MDTLRPETFVPPLLAAALSLAAAGIAVGAEQDRGYLAAIKQELARLDMDVRCDDTSLSCFMIHPAGSSGAPELQIVVKYSTATDTVYMYVDRFIPLNGASEPSASLARHLLALNSELVTAKFEWDRAGQTVRLSTVINTDSNFDRRAFRSQLLGLLQVAVRLWPELNATPDTQSKPEKASATAPKKQRTPNDTPKTSNP